MTENHYRKLEIGQKMMHSWARWTFYFNGEINNPTHFKKQISFFYLHLRQLFNADATTFKKKNQTSFFFMKTWKNLHLKLLIIMPHFFFSIDNWPKSSPNLNCDLYIYVVTLSRDASINNFKITYFITTQNFFDIIRI